MKLEDFVNGPYSMNEDMRRQWQEKEEFPPYEFALDAGKEMFAKPFKNGKTYADCFPNGGIGIRQNYPYFDEKEGKVVTLELALNRCREANGEAPYSYVKDEMASLTAYMAFTSRGKPMDIKIPNDPRALDAYRERQALFLHAPRPAEFLLRQLPCAEPGRAHPRRGAGAGARHSERDADLPLGMERHGHHQPPLRHLQQPDPRAFRWSRRPTNIATSNIILSYVATACRFRARERGHEEHDPEQPGLDRGETGFPTDHVQINHAEYALVLLLLSQARCRPRGVRGRLQGGLCRGGGRRQGGRPAAQPVDHDRSAARGSQEGADGGDFDGAISAAKEAEALAKASIFQATSEKERWKDLEIR